LAAGAVEFASVEERTALYERIAHCLDDHEWAVLPRAPAQLQQLLSERLPLCDHGPYARERDARIRAISGLLADPCGWLG